MPELSVILCTHNPRPEHIEATLRGLSLQTLERDRWELVIIDSACTTPLEATRAQQGHPTGRVAREEIPGVARARLRGITETTGDILLYVDDDNILDPDYLERSLAIAAKWPDLGVWGGQTIGRYEEEPAEWLKPWCWVAVREFQTDEWSNSPNDARAVPFGAGMCVRRRVAEFYQQSLDANPLRRLLDRTGADLGGGGDTDIAFTACKMGLGRGLFHELKLIHLIPKQRVQPEYAVNLVRATVCSYHILLHLHGHPHAPHRPWTWWQRWNRLRHVAPRERPFVTAQYDGLVRATQLIESLDTSAKDSASTKTKNPRAFEQTPLHWTGANKRRDYTIRVEPQKRPARSPHLAERREVAAQLTRHMESTPGFSYLRFGDGELRSLLAAQQKIWNQQMLTPDLPASMLIANGNPGLREQDMPRLLAAYENCTWLDRYESVPFNRDHLHELILQRPPSALSNPTPETSQIFMDWTWHEMRGYLSRHRCLFYGAEAALLKSLLATPEYREIATHFWPEDTSTIFFRQAHRDGRHLSEDLEIMKGEIREEIDLNRIDTVFLSLGGAAKILGYELSREKGVGAFDLGSLMRTLAYSGSDGHAVWRSCHYPFLLRVPFGVYMRALQDAHPNLDPVTLIAKAHAQLARELIRQEPLRFEACDVDDDSAYDPSRENRRHFLESYAVYRRHYYPWAKKHPETAPLLREFRQWRLNKGLGFDGQLYQLARSLYRRIIPARQS